MSHPRKELCDVCGERFAVTWTDSHGIAACIRCNSPYRIYHYEKTPDGEKMRKDKPPELLLKPEWLPLFRQYWKETGRKAPNSMNMPGSRYEPCARHDFEIFKAWMDAHEAEHPVQNEAEESSNVKP